MRKFLFSFLLFLFACAPPEPTTAWKAASYQDVPGIVEIATGWGRANLCTGSLVKPDVIVTAAHCATFPKEDLYINYACNDIRNNNCKRQKIKNIITHPRWNKDFISSNDIAIIIPSKNITEIPTIDISSQEELPEGLPLVAAGFGHRNGESGILYSGMGRVRRNYQYEFVVQMTPPLDPNPGDSGGPALVWEDGQMKLFGVLSRAKWANQDSTETFRYTGLAIYTKASAYTDWINSYGGLP